MNSMGQMPGQQGQQVQVKLTEEDIVECQCGSKHFTQVVRLYRKDNPIVGNPPIQAAQPAFMCVECKTVA